MRSSDPHPTDGVARSVAGRSGRKKTVIAIPAFLLSTVIMFAVAPTAIAEPTIVDDGIVTYWEPDSCRGNQPGVCPYGYPVSQFDTQNTTAPNRHVTSHQSPSP
jgi:hypothetical protein